MMKKAILFGCGEYAKAKIENIKQIYHIVGCIDNAIQPGKVEEFQGVERRHPSEIDKFDSEADIILLSFKWIEMYAQMIQLKIDDKRIVFGMCLLPYMDVVEKKLHEKSVHVSSVQQKIKMEVQGQVFWCTNKESFDEFIRILVKSDTVNEIAALPLNPIGRRFGAEFGTPIDRVYIEKFIREQSQYIHGTVMEIAEDKYARRYRENISEMQILHVNGDGENVIKGNFATGEGVTPDSVDCLICTQTLCMIFEVEKAIYHIHRILKKEGTALITVPGIVQISLYDYRNWGQYWSFTEQSIRALLKKYFAEENIDIQVYGNVKTAVGLLYGVCAENFSDEDFTYNDNQFQVIIGARVTK